MESPRVRAAPVDDDGSQGGYTRPEEEMAVSRPLANPSAPPPARATRKRSTLLAWLMGIAILVLVVAIAYWQGAASSNVVPP